MGRTVFIDGDVIGSQLNSLAKNKFCFGFLCGQSTRFEKDFIYLIIDGIASKQTDIDSILDSSTSNREIWSKMIEIISSLCAGVTIVGFYCRAKADVLKSSNFTLKMRRLFQILHSALQTYSPWSFNQSSHRILLQSEISAGESRWLVKTMDMNSENVHFRPVEMKTFDGNLQPNWCLTTTIPIQFHVWLDKMDIREDSNVKILEKQFEEQWKQYVDHLKDSSLLMDSRLLSMDTIKLPAKTSESSVDIQWLAPIDGILSDSKSNQNRSCFKIQGSVALRLFTRHSDLTGNDLRQYFIEDLFRSILIRLNLSLVNSQDPNISKLVLPRRVYANGPVFISAYQLAGEDLSAALESIQENFQINSLIENDLEAAEEFPPSVKDDDYSQKDSSTNQDSPLLHEKVSRTLDTYLGTGNTVLVTLLVLIIALLVGITLRIFS